MSNVWVHVLLRCLGTLARLQAPTCLNLSLLCILVNTKNVLKLILDLYHFPRSTSTQLLWASAHVSFVSSTLQSIGLVHLAPQLPAPYIHRDRLWWERFISAVLLRLYQRLSRNAWMELLSGGMDASWHLFQILQFKWTNAIRPLIAKRECSAFFVRNLSWLRHLSLCIAWLGLKNLFGNSSVLAVLRLWSRLWTICSSSWPINSYMNSPSTSTCPLWKGISKYSFRRWLKEGLSEQMLGCKIHSFDVNLDLLDFQSQESKLNTE